MESVLYQKAYKIAQEYDKNIKATDKRLNRWVSITLEDGAYFFFPSAFTVLHTTRHNDQPVKWLFVFTEHYGFHIYDYGTVIGFQEFTRKK